MRLLLFGGDGQVGWELRRALAPHGELTVVTRAGNSGIAGDLTNPAGIRESIREVQPHAIVNAAAYTDVEGAESNERQARLVNAEAPGIMAEEARRQDALMIHYSTDYVFDGGGDRPWRETDTPAPLNIYGRTKLEGEQAVVAASPAHLIFRTAWVYAARGRNFLGTMLRLAAERDTLEVINDQHGAPTGAEYIADVTALALAGTARNRDLCGVYHLTAGGETTWHEYATFIIAAARSAGAPVRVRDDAIKPVTSDRFPTKARRPGNSRLEGGKLETAFEVHRPDWRDGVRRAIAELVNNRKNLP